jgi:predicted  nucleic acid-binding Zn-ribbon protein
MSDIDTAALRSLVGRNQIHDANRLTETLCNEIDRMAAEIAKTERALADALALAEEALDMADEHIGADCTDCTSDLADLRAQLAALDKGLGA